MSAVTVTYVGEAGKVRFPGAGVVCRRGRPTEVPPDLAAEIEGRGDFVIGEAPELEDTADAELEPVDLEGVNAGGTYVEEER